MGGIDHFDMIDLSKASVFPIKFGESLAISHIAVENGAHFARLSIAEYPSSSTLVEQEIHFFQSFLCSFLSEINIMVLLRRKSRYLPDRRRTPQ